MKKDPQNSFTQRKNRIKTEKKHNQTKKQKPRIKNKR